MKNGWVVIRNWERFQHYRDRNPPWIKNYTELLRDENYRQLSAGERAVLHGLWLEYASSRSRIRLDAASLQHRLGLRVTSAQLERLRDAGFIEFSASAPASAALATRARTREAETETDPPNPPRGAETKSRKPKITGWRLVRGTHGMSHVPDPQGTDRPPADARL